MIYIGIARTECRGFSRFSDGCDWKLSQNDFDMHKAIIVQHKELRGCGLRKEGGTYLVGAGLAKECDRGFLVIKACPICGERPHFTRGIAKIDFAKLFGEHRPDFGRCKDGPDCVVCHPPRNINHYLMWVGRTYTLDSFIREAKRIGVCKRIAQIPIDFVVGRDWVYLARKSANAKKLGIILDNPRQRVVDVMFFAFCPTRIEYILKKEDVNNEKKIRDLVERGITPVLEVDKPDRK